MKPTRFNRATAGLLTAAMTLCFVGSTRGQSDQPSLDELLNLSSSEPTTNDRAPDKPTPADPNEGLNESVKRALSASDAADVFEQAINEMNQVSRRLGRTLDPGVQTQRMQESILQKLDQVIESAKQQSSSGSGSGGSGKPSDQDQGGEKPAQQKPSPGNGQGQPQPGGQQASTGAAGSGTPDNPDAQDTPIEQLRKEWGVLPPRVREELSDGLRERFSPLYRRMTEAYYKALAEQE